MVAVAIDPMGTYKGALGFALVAFIFVYDKIGLEYFGFIVV